MERNYFAQGCRPDYTDPCAISDDEAAGLAASGLIDPWFTDIPVVATADPADHLSFEVGAHSRNLVMLRLPRHARREPIEMEVPGLEHLLRAAARDPARLAALLERSRIAVAGMKPLSRRAPGNSCSRPS